MRNFTQKVLSFFIVALYIGIAGLGLYYYSAIKDVQNEVSQLEKQEKQDSHDLQRVRKDIKQHKSSIVRLYNDKQNDEWGMRKQNGYKLGLQRKNGRFYGTGWFIEEDLIVTNYHVTTLMNDIEIELPTKNNKKVDGTILAESQKYDLAFVDPDLPKNFSVNPLELNTNELDRYQEIIHFGYPFKLNYFAFGATLQQTTWGMKGRRMEIGEHPVWSCKLTSGPGASGSPIFDQKGRVVGVLEAVRRGFDNTLFIPAKYIQKLYDQLNNRGLKSKQNRLEQRVDYLERLIKKLQAENSRLKYSLKQIKTKLKEKLNDNNKKN